MTAGRLLVGLVGALFVLVGLFLVPAPGPGWATVILGLVLLATAFRPVARVLDWAEPKLRSAWEQTRAGWRPASVAAKVMLAAVAILMAAGMFVAAYMALGSWV